MNFEMRGPCAKCPFRCDVPGYLRQDRAEEIADAITQRQQTFACHATVDYTEEWGGTVTSDTQHCAGALIMLEHMERPNQMMRIAERLGMYDRHKLRMDAPVFTDAEDFIAHHDA